MCAEGDLCACAWLVWIVPNLVPIPELGSGLTPWAVSDTIDPTTNVDQRRRTERQGPGQVEGKEVTKC
jgi:hypothetical protein